MQACQIGLRPIGAIGPDAKVTPPPTAAGPRPARVVIGVRAGAA
jgi:hypothetical protein